MNDKKNFIEKKGSQGFPFFGLPLKNCGGAICLFRKKQDN